MLTAAVALGLATPAIPAAALPATTQSYHVTVTCKVPKSQPHRRLAHNSCLNYLRDGTQTYVAHVKDSAGNPVSGVTVTWADSDSTDASFRAARNPCVTGSHGTCSDELADSHPTSGERITITATAGGSSATGYLTFK